MFKEIFAFELKYRVRRPATWLYFLVLFLFFCISAIYGGVPGSRKAFVNSSYVYHSMLALVSIFGVMFSSAIMGVPVYRDIEHDTRGYLLTYPIRERSYLLGRFAGSFVVLVFVCLGAALGLMVGSWLGPVFGQTDADRFGPQPWFQIGNAVVLLLVPNLFLTGTIFFSLVALTRKIFVAYAGSILFFIAYLVAATLTSDIEQRSLANLLDPFAFTTFGNLSRYWTPAEQNVEYARLTGDFLWNRLIWLGVSLGTLAFTLYRFNFADFMAVKLGRKKAKADALPAKAATTVVPRVSQAFGNGMYIRMLFRQAWLEFTNVVRDVYFLSILLGGFGFLFFDGWFGFPSYGTPSLPVTYYMLEVKDFNYIIFVYILLIFYTGEVVHRDRSVRFNHIADALPMPNWMVYGSKFLAMVLVCLLLVNLPLVSGVLNQTLKGYHHYEFGKYFADLYLIELPEYLQLTMLAFFVHILVNNKFPGHVVSIGIWVVMFALRSFGEYDYNLFFYSYTPGYTLSDMNGFGHFWKPLGWFNAYWLSLGMLLLVVGNLLWARGAETDWRTRLRIAQQRLNPAAGTALTLLTLAWLGAGAYIYYNVSVLNVYQTRKQNLDSQAAFERAYQRLERALQPKITDVKLFADLVPEERRATVRAVSTMTNKWQKPIDTLYVSLSENLKYLKINGQALQPVFRDGIMKRHKPDNSADLGNGFMWFKLPKTLQPGDTVVMETLVELTNPGFPNSGTSRDVVYNGTFYTGGVPTFGYSSQSEINDDIERKKRKLPEKKYQQPPQNDAWGLGNLLFNDDADYITYEATVSTTPDQIAVSPGYLQREWTANGRRYFHYKMDGEMDMFFTLVSARYAVKRDAWKGKNGQAVNIEIFYHPSHTYNVDRFVRSVKASMDYYNRYYTPYQYRQMRILEFPRYAGFAQSFPNTVPFSESFAWVTDFSDPAKTDYCFYVTAHEVAHQWWGHQITPSNTRGANQLSESLAEYSALMVLKHEYGEEAMQKFLRYTLDRYLRGRAGENKFEETMAQNDSRSYVWYDKGSLVMYGLQDLIGEEAVNRGLRRFLDSAAFRPKAPFATTGEFLPYLRAVVPDSAKYFLEDGWEKIALYENRIVKAISAPLSGDRHKVTLTVSSKKLYYDGKGNETGAGKGKDYVDIGIFAADGKNARGLPTKTPLYLRKYALGPGEHTIEITVKGKPLRAGIDPYNKLIDRVPDDNMTAVEEN